MWYSALSTGILEIDTQHGDIDSILQLYENSETVDSEEKWLRVLLTSIEAHFEFEEVLFGDKFPQDHREKHAELLEVAHRQVALHRSGALQRPTLIGFFRKMLFEHVTTFDDKLKDL
jgi:hemerythrin-like metal-binding protein